MPTPYRLQAIALKDVGVFDDILMRFNPIEDPNVDEELAELHIFTGPNGSGKSTLLYAIADLFTFNCPNTCNRFTSMQSRTDYIFSDNTYSRIPDNNNNIAADSLAFGKRLRATLAGATHRLFSEENKKKYRLVQQYIEETDLRIPFSPLKLKDFYFAVFSYAGQREVSPSALDSIKEISNPPLQDSLSFTSKNKFDTLSQWIANSITKSAIAFAAGEKEESEYYKSNITKICDFIKSICDLSVQFNVERNPLSVTMTIDGRHIPIDTLPDGLKSIISWTCDLASRLERIPWAHPGDIFSQPIILLLDEIDIHLHPKWQRRILPATQKLLSNAQIFATTHSPFVVGSVDHAWIYELPEKGKQREREIKGIKSNPGKSYSLILKEVFGVEEEFGEEVEKMFDAFYAYKDKFLTMGEEKDNLYGIAEQLRSKSEEVALIVDREIRQIERISKK